MVTVTRYEPGKPPEVIAGDPPAKKRAEPGEATLLPGERSKALAAKIEKLEAARTEQLPEVQELEAAVEERQGKLDGLRAAGLLETVDQATLRAFEKELSGLQKELAEGQSALTGLDRLLAEARAELAEAQKQEAEEALQTKALTEAQKSLEKNARALEKARKALLETLEAGAEALLEEVGPLLERWQALVKERRRLYARQVNITDYGDADRQMATDSLAVPFPKGYDVDDVLSLAEVLLPLIEMGQGWPRVQGRKRERPW